LSPRLESNFTSFAREVLFTDTLHEANMVFLANAIIQAEVVAGIRTVGTIAPIARFALALE
jgi:hypothetical protein